MSVNPVKLPPGCTLFPGPLSLSPFKLFQRTMNADEKNWKIDQKVHTFFQPVWILKDMVDDQVDSL